MKWTTAAATGVAVWFVGSWLWEALSDAPFSCQARAADIEAKIEQEMEQLARAVGAAQLYLDQTGLP